MRRHVLALGLVVIAAGAAFGLSRVLPLSAEPQTTPPDQAKIDTPESHIPAELELPAGPGVALVELFTSEGCSSCPPADEYANEIVHAAARDDARVYVIAWHVDYWNRLGWFDPFSSAAHSERQRRYAGAFGDGRLYTPMMIINGAGHFVGSDRAEGHTRLEGALAGAPAYTLSINRLRLDANLSADPDADQEEDPDADGSDSYSDEPARAAAPVTVTLGVTVQLAGAETDGSDSDRDLELCAVLVEDELISRVERGENAGRTLRHDAVARATAVTPFEVGRPVEFSLNAPGKLDADALRVIVFVQHPETMRVLGAIDARVPPEAPTEANAGLSD